MLPLSARHFFFYVKDKGGEPPQMEARRLPRTHSSVRDSEWFTSRAQLTVFCFYLIFNQFLRKMMMNSYSEQKSEVPGDGKERSG